MGLFVAGEGRRSYGRTTTASMPHRTVLTVRQPLGVAGLIMSFNTPLPNVAWKAFPAVFCGNARGRQAVGAHARVRHRSSAQLAREAGVPAGRAQRRPGARRRGGRCRSSSTRTSTSSASRARPRPGAGSTRPPGAGSRRSASSSAARTRSSSATTPTSTNAVRWALASAFSNAGQRCASASRIVVFDDGLRRRSATRLVEEARALTAEPVISEASLERILGAVARAAQTARRCSRRRAARAARAGISPPTVLEGAAPDAEISCTELFGPVTILYRVARPRRGDRARERLAVRPHRGDPHGEPPPRDALRREGRRRASSS